MFLLKLYLAWCAVASIALLLVYLAIALGVFDPCKKR